MARRILTVTVGLDLATLVVAQVIASLTTFRTPFPWSFRSDALTMVGAFTGSALVAMYISRRSAGNGVFRPSYGRAVSAVALALGLTALVILFGRPYWSRNYVVVGAATWLGLMLVHRWVQRRRPWAENIVLVTGEKVLIDHLKGAPHANVLEVLDPAGTMPERPLPAGTTLAVDLRSVLSDEMARFVSSCNLAGYPMVSLVNAYEEHTGRLAIVHLYEGWELTVPLSGRIPYVRFKRVIDTFLVVVTAPLVLVVGLLFALAIRLDSRGPVIFRQFRIGLEGRPFTLYKFRTMRVGAGDGEARFARPGDDRLTRVGRLLRRTRLDELPQLWNVLKGDLALVGPRPEQGPFVERFSQSIPFYTHRHLVRPGLTGWAQVNFGYADSEADTVEKLSYDLYYVKHLSPWLDLEILGRSVWTVLSGFGAR
ncbi:MAG: exopolysaccharide biosynthesis polyprenyl glycosylphosphotransferase [Acidimicrobiia bacterium]|nr:exopolysaccharide biosynthesis polyprenyl glycosylphosphotransferase [Acidimicrobiia bacterium]